MQSRNQVIVLLTGLVIEQSAVLQRLLDVRQTYRPQTLTVRQGGKRCHLQSVQCHPGIPVGPGHQVVQGFLAYLKMELAQSSFLVLNGPVHDELDLFVAEQVQPEDPASRKKRGDDFE